MFGFGSKTTCPTCGCKLLTPISVPKVSGKKGMTRGLKKRAFHRTGKWLVVLVLLGLCWKFVSILGIPGMGS